MLLLFPRTRLDIAVERDDSSSLGRILTKIIYLLASWGMVAVPTSVLLVMNRLRDMIHCDAGGELQKGPSPHP
ncbi:MAG: hypothetical protein J7J65_05780 [Candidatus Korarchaeota archaeon]|nr:hypothetical protein [Candidatus Korarchaeota archaeon]